VSKQLNFKKLARVLAMAGSAHEGEALAAIRTADRMLRAAGGSWTDLLEPQEQLALATEAAAVLIAENHSMRAELEQLRSASAPWSSVGTDISNTRRVAKWALDLHDKGQVWLSPSLEVGFLRTCSTWKGRLTPKMQPVFQQIVDRVARHTGLTPPA
jgi:hypothetical protein